MKEPIQSLYNQVMTFQEEWLDFGLLKPHLFIVRDKEFYNGYQGTTIQGLSQNNVLDSDTKLTISEHTGIMIKDSSFESLQNWREFSRLYDKKLDLIEKKYKFFNKNMQLVINNELSEYDTNIISKLKQNDRILFSSIDLILQHYYVSKSDADIIKSFYELLTESPISKLKIVLTYNSQEHYPTQILLIIPNISRRQVPIFEMVENNHLRILTNLASGHDFSFIMNSFSEIDTYIVIQDMIIYKVNNNNKKRLYFDGDITSEKKFTHDSTDSENLKMTEVLKKRLNFFRK